MSDDGAQVEILLLTQDDCRHCTNAKAIIAKLAEEYRLRVSSEDFSTPRARTLAMEGGFMFAPGIVINGRPFAYGRPSEGMLRRELERLGAARR